jgi:hypothetical protein
MKANLAMLFTHDISGILKLFDGTPRLIPFEKGKEREITETEIVDRKT